MALAVYSWTNRGLSLLLAQNRRAAALGKVKQIQCAIENSSLVKMQVCAD
jgi:hypothetical protein